MPKRAIGTAIHDDTSHVGSAKRNAASGVKGIDAAQNLTPKAVMADIDAAIINAASGLAGLDAGSKVAIANLPVNVASGLAGLDAGSKVAIANLPVNVASGLAGLDASVLLALTQQRLNFKTGTFQRVMTTASGTQAITGVGFIPRLVLFYATRDAPSPEMSFGVDDGTTSFYIMDNHNVSANTFYGATSQALNLVETGGLYYQGHITSFDADGFTITWTRVGAKTGTAYVYYLAIK